jgi:hypothetical protein
MALPPDTTNPPRSFIDRVLAKRAPLGDCDGALAPAGSLRHMNFELGVLRKLEDGYRERGDHAEAESFRIDIMNLERQIIAKRAAENFVSPIDRARAAWKISARTAIVIPGARRARRT